MLFNLLRLTLVGLLCVGLYGAATVSYLTITDVSPCPDVLGLPACYIVFLGYSVMLISVIIGFSKREGNDFLSNRVFLFGWLPVFLLALVGSLLEMYNGETCPKSEAGLPLCYVSLLFSVLVFVCQRIMLRDRKA